ncbi:heavy-metal-associated domain-containing protein [Novosphingobium lindaniclasticum]|nr:heavy-metal-associated domain-containing protein [Novosphingobium lindaniclasticum]
MQFLVPDMTCGSCVKHVREAITALDSSATVEADTVERKISVSTTALQADVEKALADDGYPVTAI